MLTTALKDSSDLVDGPLEVVVHHDVVGELAPHPLLLRRHLQPALHMGLVVAPPSQPRLEFEGDSPEVQRDEHGIAKGGIRLPQVEVPVAQNSSIPLGEDIYSRLGGSCRPFSDEKLRALYGDKATYLARFEEAARAAEKAGVLLPRDVETMLEEARRSFVL